MLSSLKLDLSEYAEILRFWVYNRNISEIFRLSFEDIFLGTLDKNEPTLGGSGGGGRTVRSAGS